MKRSKQTFIDHSNYAKTNDKSTLHAVIFIGIVASVTTVVLIILDQLN